MPKKQKLREIQGPDACGSLEGFFSPRSAAVIGASRTEGKIGHAVLSNIVQSGFAGAIYPINPSTDEILGLPCYPDINAIQGPIDLAVVVIPAKFVLEILESCGRRGVKATIVITAGFRETGHDGLMAEKRMGEIAETYGMRILGRNCLGLIDTLVPINASFAAAMPEGGEIAFMSQSGALCTSVLDIAPAQRVGFSRFLSLGNKADMDEAGFLEAWAEDPGSKVVMAYLEGISDGPGFIRVARHSTKQELAIAIKSGTTSAGSKP